MRVLFICEGNVNRSQMAGAFFTHAMPEADVITAGTLVSPEWEDRLVSDMSVKGIEVMQEIGIDTSHGRMHKATPEMVDSADIVVMITPTLGGPIPSFITDSPKTRLWNISDPGYNQAPHVAVRDAIRTEVNALAQELR